MHDVKKPTLYVYHNENLTKEGRPGPTHNFRALRILQHIHVAFEVKSAFGYLFKSASAFS